MTPTSSPTVATKADQNSAAASSLDIGGFGNVGIFVAIVFIAVSFLFGFAFVYFYLLRQRGTPVTQDPREKARTDNAVVDNV